MHCHTSPHRIRAVALFLTTASPLAGCVSASSGDSEIVEPPDEERATDEVVDALESATAAWHASCATEGTDGLCVRFEATEDTRGCAPPILGGVHVSARSARAGAVQDDLERALSTAREVESPRDPEQRARLDRAIGAAEIARVDTDIEAYLSLAPPSDPAASADYLASKTESGQKLVIDLATFKDAPDPQAIVRAALRTSWVSIEMSDRLLAFEVPADFTADQRQQYCDAVAERAAPPREVGHQAAAWCTEKAAELGYDGPQVDDCARLARQLGTP